MPYVLTTDSNAYDDNYDDYDDDDLTPEDIAAIDAALNEPDIPFNF